MIERFLEEMTTKTKNQAKILESMVNKIHEQAFQYIEEFVLL